MSMSQTYKSMDFILKYDVNSFELELKEAKGADPFPWYPYGSLSNFYLLDMLLPNGWSSVQSSLKGKYLVDIGAADGETSFFLEKRGINVDIVDNPSTNYNSLRGAARLKARLGSKVNIHEIDLDSQFVMPRKYDFAFFLGILYHLKNPYFVLESLSGKVQRMVLSTRIASHDKPGGTCIRSIPAAYLLSPVESNNDSTNYWTFTEAGIIRLLERTGWDVIHAKSFGSVGLSDPFSPDRDERFFCFLESRQYK
jgi:2-polyprenyl-3-methyl-5-hydroxy-6-metoxy-1,4-benzoquinol methylase